MPFIILWECNVAVTEVENHAVFGYPILIYVIETHSSNTL